MSALSSLDLVFMSDLEQQVIRCLNEYPNIAALEVAKIIKVPEKDVRRILQRLMDMAKVVCRQQKGRKTYAVNYRNLTESRVRNMPQNIWTIFD
ncbi:MAG: TrmB family transcriptional regulator [Chloroflexi bacterium]|nr:TrmB family transcriptional regulator [Chloroflexota bacterium]